jgi:hypothetical protein
MLICLVLLVGALSTRADFGLMAWTPADGVNFGFTLPYYGSVLTVNAILYCSSYLWDDVNASSVTFSNVYTSGGLSFSYLSMSSNVNATFDTISSDKLSYSVVANGSQAFSGTSAPSSVTVDGDGAYSDWSFVSGVLTVNNASASVVVLFDVSAISAEDAVAVAVVFGVIAICVVAGLIFIRRKKNDGYY